MKVWQAIDTASCFSFNQWDSIQYFVSAVANFISNSTSKDKNVHLSPGVLSHDRNTNISRNLHGDIKTLNDSSSAASLNFRAVRIFTMRRQRNWTQGKLFTYVVYFETIRRNECYLLVIIIQFKPHSNSIAYEILNQIKVFKGFRGLKHFAYYNLKLLAIENI